jgi:hypothetical protein
MLSFYKSRVHRENNFAGQSHASGMFLLSIILSIAEKQVRGSVKVNKLEILVSYCS